MKTFSKSEIYEKAVKLEQKYIIFESIQRNCNDPEILAIVQKIRNRKTKVVILSVKEFCDKLIERRLLQIARALPDEGYSMGSFVKAVFNKIQAIDDRTSNYTASCKYRPTHGSVSLKLSLDELKHTTVIANLVTYIYPNQKSKVKKCFWYYGVSKKQRFELVKVEGFIYGGYHSRVKNDALKGGQANIEREKLQQLRSIKFNKALRLRYSFEDSMKAGNCEAGTRAFCIRLQLKENRKYRGKFILDIAKEKSGNSVFYIERMINYRANLLK